MLIFTHDNENPKILKCIFTQSDSVCKYYVIIYNGTVNSTLKYISSYTFVENRNTYFQGRLYMEYLKLKVQLHRTFI